MAQTDPVPSPEMRSAVGDSTAEIATPSGAVSAGASGLVPPVDEPSRPPSRRPDNQDAPELPWWKRLLFGRPKDIRDKEIFHSISLVAFLA